MYVKVVFVSDCSIRVFSVCFVQMHHNLLCKLITDLVKALTQSDVTTVVSSDIQSSGCQEKPTDVTEVIPDAKNSNDNVLDPCLTDANVGISSNNIPTPHVNLDASSSLSDSAAAGT